jgi:Uncharacterized conserved protein (DUF2267)
MSLIPAMDKAGLGSTAACSTTNSSPLWPRVPASAINARPSRRWRPSSACSAPAGPETRRPTWTANCRTRGVRRCHRKGRGSGPTLAELYARVALAEGGGTNPQEARRHVRAVLAAVKVGLTGGEYDHIGAQLPADYGDLLATEPVQHH